MRKSSPPIVPRRDEAPTTATLARLEERSQRGADGDVVALLDAELVALGRSEVERHLDDAPFQLARELEAGALEDAEHRPVLRQHLGDEPLDPHRGRARGELLEQARPDAAPLVGVRDRERHLRDGGIAQAHVVGDGDHSLVPVLVRQRAQERATLDPVRLEHRLDELRAEARQAVEPESQALLRQRPEEAEQRLGVLAPGRPQPEGAAVAQDDVDHVGCDAHRPIVAEGAGRRCARRPSRVRRRPPPRERVARGRPDLPRGRP